MADGGKGEDGDVIGLDHLFLLTGSFGDSWRFWTEIVGLPAGHTWGEGSGRAGMATLGGSALVVAGGEEGPSAEFGYENERGRPQVFLKARGLDALCAAMKGRGAEVLREPFTTHWGPRCFTVRAPDGLVVGFVE